MRGRSRDTGGPSPATAPKAGEAVQACGAGSACGCEIAADRTALQRYAGNRAVAQAMSNGHGGGGDGSLPTSVTTALSEPGESLDPTFLDSVEGAFGDLGSVRVHSGPSAARAAQDLGALAFTSGRHIVFGAGQYSPSSSGGRELIAHELVHVRQQVDGRTGMLAGTGGNPSARAALEREAAGAPVPHVGSQQVGAAGASASRNGGPSVATAHTGAVTQSVAAPALAGGAIQMQTASCLRLLRQPGASTRAIGIAVHSAIRQDFRRRAGPLASYSFPDASFDPFRTDKRSTVIDPQMGGGKGQGTGNPDLSYRSGKRMLVAEIKPANWLELVAGESQLANYISKGNSDDNAPLRQRLGVKEFVPMFPRTYKPRPMIVYGRRYEMSWCGPGILVYKAVERKKKKKKKKKQDKKQKKQQKRQQKRTTKKAPKKTPKAPKKTAPKAKKPAPKPKPPKAKPPKAGKPGPQVGAFNFGLGLSIGSSGAGAGNVGVGVSIMSSGVSVGTVSAGVVIDSEGAAVGAVGAGASVSSSSAGAGVAGAGMTKDSTTAGAGVAGAGTATGVTGAAAGVAGTGNAKDVTGTAAGRTGSGDVTGGTAGGAGAGTGAREGAAGGAAGREGEGSGAGSGAGGAAPGAGAREGAGGGAGTGAGTREGAGGAGGAAAGTREGAGGGGASTREGGAGGAGGDAGAVEGETGGDAGTREGAAGGTGEREGATGGTGTREGAAGGADAGTGGAQAAPVGDAKLAEIVARLGLPPGKNGPATRAVVDAIRLDQLVSRSTPAQKTLLRVLAASSEDGIYKVPDAAWVEMMLQATAGLTEQDLEYLAQIEWEPANVTLEELRKSIQEALAAARAAQRAQGQPSAPKDKPGPQKPPDPAGGDAGDKGGRRDPAADKPKRRKGIRKPKLANTPVSKIVAALSGLPWGKARPGGLYYEDAVKPGLVFGMTEHGTRWGALVNFTTKKVKTHELLLVKEASVIVVLDDTKEAEALQFTALNGEQHFTFINASKNQAATDGSTIVNLIVDEK